MVPEAAPSASAVWFCDELVDVSAGSGAVVVAPCSVSEVAGPVRFVVLLVVPLAFSVVPLSSEESASDVLLLVVSEALASTLPVHSLLEAASSVVDAVSVVLSLVAESLVALVALDVVSLDVADRVASTSWSVAVSADAEDSEPDCDADSEALSDAD